MPINGVMTLGDIVDAGNKGRDDRQQQVQYQRGLKQQQVGDAANARASGIFNDALAAGEDRDVAMLKATEAFGQQFAEAGQWQDYLKHEASVHPQRLRVRAKAMQQYSMDGNTEQLLRTVYATIPDGQSIEAVEQLPGGAPVDRGTAPTVAAGPKPQTMAQVQGGFDTEMTNPLGVQAAPTAQGMDGIVQPGRPGDGRLGAPSGPAQVRVKLTSGEVRPVDIPKFLAGLKQSLADPMKSAEQEIELNFLRAKEGVQTAGKVAVERVKGEEGRKTEGVKGTFQADRDTRQAAERRTLADMNNKADMARTQVSAGATLGAARIRSAGGSGGSGGSGAKTLQSTKTDEDGYLIGVFKDGTVQRLTEGNKPIKAESFAKRIDKTANDILKAHNNQLDNLTSPMSMETAREKAAEQLAKGLKSEDGDASPKAPAPARLNQFTVIR